ncbi:hypothetical protein AG1IA_09944 [Rhizoctonia solani AG-1 IA]|uniref:Uncharacterized protein n=1 Tax=Thanatephorus cucumeris (strain AG1-IA) TaxID=983506 RepID=L8WCW6_THACA|nr:hypothetical protein AG1IA_09944 [Rhizoctonia solani AG-1 IA]
MAILSSPQFEDYILLNSRQGPETGHVQNDNRTPSDLAYHSMVCPPRHQAMCECDRGHVAATTIHRLDQGSRNYSQGQTRSGFPIKGNAHPTVPSPIAIQVLRNTAPIFLQTAYSYPELWPENADLTCIPLPLESHNKSNTTYLAPRSRVHPIHTNGSTAPRPSFSSSSPRSTPLETAAHALEGGKISSTSS